MIADFDPATTADDASGAAEPRTTGRLAGFVALGVIAALFGGTVALVQATGQPDHAPVALAMTTADAPPVALETLRTAVADQYRHAEGHADLYRAVPCYCGCDRFADHANLYDCFLRRDGAGYDAHAAGCAICQAEATQVQRLQSRGVRAPEIRQMIIDEFGPATNPSRT